MNLTLITTSTILIGFVLTGCQKPSEVQLATDQEILEIEGISEADSSLDAGAVDTTALLPRDQRNYAGFATMSSATFDWGHDVRTTTTARVLVVNKAKRIPFRDREIFFGRLLGIVRINGEIMIPRLRIAGNLESGVEYVREIAGHYPRRTYSFTADSLSTAIEIEAPENLVVLSPVGGQRIQRNTDLTLRWNGTEHISLIIGKLRIEAGETRIVPVLNIRARKSSGSVVLSNRVLRLLPAGEYVFTFVTSNRNDLMMTRYQGKLLMQASSIYNVRVDLI